MTLCFVGSYGLPWQIKCALSSLVCVHKPCIYKCVMHGCMYNSVWLLGACCNSWAQLLLHYASLSCALCLVVASSYSYTVHFMVYISQNLSQTMWCEYCMKIPNMPLYILLYSMFVLDNFITLLSCDLTSTVKWNASLLFEGYYIIFGNVQITVVMFTCLHLHIMLLYSYCQCQNYWLLKK